MAFTSHTKSIVNSILEEILSCQSEHQSHNGSSLEPMSNVSAPASRPRSIHGRRPVRPHRWHPPIQSWSESPARFSGSRPATQPRPSHAFGQSPRKAARGNSARARRRSSTVSSDTITSRCVLSLKFFDSSPAVSRHPTLHSAQRPYDFSICVECINIRPTCRLLRPLSQAHWLYRSALLLLLPSGRMPSPMLPT